jgi:hypothetical protein
MRQAFESKTVSSKLKWTRRETIRFPRLAAGRYTGVDPRWYPTQEAAPCQVLMAKMADKNSTVARDKDRFVQQVFIEGFSNKAGKK